MPPEWVAVVAVLDRLQRQPYHWPVGRIMFQKLSYFATEAGVATGLSFEHGSYGSFSSDLKRRIGQLENNGLAVETKRGQMFEVQVGPTYADAVAQVRDRMEPYRDAVERTVDLMARMDTSSAEVAATVHFVAAEALRASGEVPKLSHVLERVEAWNLVGSRPRRLSTPSPCCACGVGPGFRLTTRPHRSSKTDFPCD